MFPLITVSSAFVVGLLCGSAVQFASLSWSETPIAVWLGLAVTLTACGLTLWSPRPIFLGIAMFGLGLIGSPLSFHGPAEKSGWSLNARYHRWIVRATIREARQTGQDHWVIEADHAVLADDVGSTAGPIHRRSVSVVLWTNRPPAPGLTPGRRITADCIPISRMHRVPLQLRCRTIAVWAGSTEWSAGRLRTWLRKRTDRLVGQATTSQSDMLWAILLGSKLRHKRGIKSAFARMGIAHVLVVSGLHLGMLALLALVFWRLFFALIPGLADRYPTNKASAWLALPAVWLYVLVAGGSAATVRAGIMATSLLVGVVADRPTTAARSLILAGLSLLIWRPRWLFQPGYQLSFAATAALIWLGRIWIPGTQADHKPIGEHSASTALPARLAAISRTAFLASLAAWAATAPLAAHWFGGLSLAGPFANLMAVPFFCWIVLPLGLTGLGVGLIWPAAGRPLLSLADRMSDMAARTVVQLARQTDWAWIQAQPDRWQTIAALGMVSLAGVLMLHWRRTVRPWAPRRLGILLLLLAGAGIAIKADLRKDSRGMRLMFLGRKAGHAVVVITHDAVVLVDTGRGRAGGMSVIAELKRRNIRKLDLVVVTHPHWDHTSGLATLVRGFPVKELWMAGSSAKGPWQDIRNAAKLQRVPVNQPRDVSIGKLRIHVLRPLGRRGDDLDPSLSRNDNSLAIRFEYRGRSFLVLGDMERRGQKLLTSKANLRSDVLAAPHHGSAQSFCRQFVSAVDPSLVVISGHTATTSPALYSDQGAKVVLTDQQGPLEVTLSAKRPLPDVRTLSK